MAGVGRKAKRNPKRRRERQRESIGNNSQMHTHKKEKKIKGSRNEEGVEGGEDLKGSLSSRVGDYGTGRHPSTGSTLR